MDEGKEDGSGEETGAVAEAAVEEDLWRCDFDEDEDEVGVGVDEGWPGCVVIEEEDGAEDEVDEVEELVCDFFRLVLFLGFRDVILGVGIAWFGSERAR